MQLFNEAESILDSLKPEEQGEQEETVSDTRKKPGNFATIIYASRLAEAKLRGIGWAGFGALVMPVSQARQAYFRFLIV
jgi:hypothetical protein